MAVNPFSRYCNLPIMVVKHTTKGATHSLPIRRSSVSTPPVGSFQHRLFSYEAIDLLALKYFGREELQWHLMDANGGKLPDSFKPGEILFIPPLSMVTRIDIKGR